MTLKNTRILKHLEKNSKKYYQISKQIKCFCYSALNFSKAGAKVEGFYLTTKHFRIFFTEKMYNHSIELITNKRKYLIN